VNRTEHTSPTADDVVDPTRLDGATALAVVTELTMIYDADGGLRGELAYGWGKLRRTAHCSLCSITHGLVRERRSWVDWRCSVPVPVEALHRNERSPEVEEITGDRTPCVLARVEGAWVFVLGPGELDACDGDVDVFAKVLVAALQRVELSFPGVS
jgi:hypothetical protein